MGEDKEARNGKAAGEWTGPDGMELDWTGGSGWERPSSAWTEAEGTG